MSIINLSNLEKYKTELNDYISDTILTEPTPKEIMELNGELIDNFTGNSLTKNGNVQIDEYGIASNFAVGSYVLSTSNSAEFGDDFEVNIKFKMSANKNSYSKTYTWASTATRYDPPWFTLFSTFDYGQRFATIGYRGSGANHTAEYIYGDVRLNYTDFNTERKNVWLIYNLKIKDGSSTTKILDENYNVLASNIINNIPTDYKNQTAKIAFGNYCNTVGQPTNIVFDLSETWIKKENNLISSWNK